MDKGFNEKLTELFPGLKEKSADYLRGFGAAVQSLFNVTDQMLPGSGGSMSMDPDNPPTARARNVQSSGSSSKDLFDRFNDNNKKQSDDDTDSDDKSTDAKGKSKPKQTPRIGDKGDQAIQEAEDLERRANAVTDDAGELIEDAKGAGDTNTADKLEDAKDKAEKIGEAAGDISDKLTEDNKKGEVKSRGKKALGDPKKVEARLQDLKRILSDVEDTMNKITSETTNVRRKEKMAVGDKAAQKYKSTPLNRFRESLNAFFRRETDFGRGKTWRRFSKNYQGSSIIRKGTARNVQGHIPIINVYFDMSSSWDAPKIEVGKQAVATLNKYVQRGETKINLYYFSDEITSDPNDSRLQRSTAAGPDIVKHVVDTKADNVIIMTDSDTDYQGDYRKVSPIKVPGMVWFLAKGGIPTKLPDYIRGSKGTKLFSI